MPIDRQNYEEFFLLYVDGELNAGERADVEAFANTHPDLKEELDLLATSVLVPEENIVFENKESLFRKEESRKLIVLFNWRTMTAAAAVLLMLGAAGWLFVNQTSSKPHGPQDMASVQRTQKDDQDRRNQLDHQKRPDADVAASENTHANIPGNELSKNSAGLSNQNKTPSENVNNRRRAPGDNEKNDLIADRGRARRDDRIREERNSVRNNDAASKQDANNAAEADEPHSPESSKLSHDLATITDQPADVSIPVSARELPASASRPNDSSIRYADETESDNNTVYFANASFSKRNSLRVVFRKASRIIDRLTTIQ